MQGKYKSLHDAVVHGSYVDVLLFIRNKSNINERDQNGNTPLLLTVCVEEERIYNKIMQVLIENGADVNATNKGLTTLFNAVFYRRIIAIKMLLKAGAWLNIHANNFELHILAQRGDKEILEIFLKDPRCTSEMTNFSDTKNRTAVYFAAKNCHKSTLKMLIQHGGMLTYDSEFGTIFEAIFEEVSTPVQFLDDILDAQITLKTILFNENHKKTYVVDFNVLAPKSCVRQMTVINNMLAAASDDEKTQVLQHPLIDLFLSLKWLKIRIIFCALMGLHAIFALSIGTYVHLMLHDRYNRYHNLKCTVISIIIITSIILLFHEISQCVLATKNVLKKIELLLNISCNGLSLMVCCMALVFHDTDYYLPDSPNWVQHVTSLAVLLAWIELMFLIGRLPTFGYYALMFAAVLQNVIKVLFTFLCLIIGFSLSFSILFYDTKQFSDPWQALVKTTIMMMGEFEYVDLFHSGNYSSNALSPPTQLIFLAFIILTSVVLMNLMVGLAVSDIQGLQEESIARKVEKQADFVRQIEELNLLIANSRIFPKWLKKLVQKNIRINNTYIIEPTARFQRKSHLSKKLIGAIVSIGKKNAEQSKMEQSK